MINYINAIIFGVVQGLTEFLPVSSSGHLVILHKLIELPKINEMSFDVVLHLATFFAVFWFYKKDILELLIGWIKTLKGNKDEQGRISWLIIIGTIPASIAGFLWEDIIENVLRSPLVVIIMLVLVGIFFIAVERYSSKKYDITNLNWKKSLFIGISQTIALIPGTSRSGITIIAGLTQGLKREEAIKYSFLLSMPVILGAGITKIPHLFSYGIFSQEGGILVVSFFVTFISGLLAVKYFLKFARKYSLNIFAYYRFILAALLTVYFYL